MPTPPVSTPITVSLRNDYEVVVHGLAEMLRSFRPWLEVVNVGTPNQGQQRADITLFDTFAHNRADGADIDHVVADPQAGKVVIYAWVANPALIAAARQRGVHGYLTKDITGEQLAQALLAIHRGRDVFIDPDHHHLTARDQHGSWPGQLEGLTVREAEVIALITQGLSNQHICEQLYLTINSIKSHVRSAYRKMGVTSRSQAVLWGVRHGMLTEYTHPDRTTGQ